MSEQIQRMGSDAGFIAALDQSGGSTPKALRLYGVDESAYSNDAEMFDAVHAMRSRIMTNPSFNGKRILGAILFQNTLDRDVAGMPSSEYLWREKRILPILKIDYGMADVADGVQVMKPIPDLDERLPAAKAKSVFGTKMRSVIASPSEAGIARVVEQQFAFADEVRGHGLVPIIEPEVDIHAEDKPACEAILREELGDGLDGLDGEVPVMFKLTLPDEANYYREFCTHPKVLRVVALSGGYSREESNQKLAANNGMIASFSRALTEGLHVDLDDAAFTDMLDGSIASIARASAT
ncbi:MAG: fructose bisphosphate aldolase [Gammaproteobacteria bacterium]|nr:fructose bisphosphate aldolase [Gammaproteobacteria bacterium]